MIGITYLLFDVIMLITGSAFSILKVLIYKEILYLLCSMS
jgi:hypothetical protein